MNWSRDCVLVSRVLRSNSSMIVVILGYLGGRRRLFRWLFMHQQQNLSFVGVPIARSQQSSDSEIELAMPSKRIV